MPRHDADLIIAGAGCAGLSALWQVLDSPARDRRVIVVDRDFEPRDDRTWAFWGTTASPFAELADSHWDRVQVKFPGWELTDALDPVSAQPSTRRTYMRVRSRTYDRAVMDAAAARPNVRFVGGDIVDIRDEAESGVVVLADGELHAPVVFQSALLSPADRRTPVRHPLRQHFGGWEVRTQQPVFDPGVVTLMDFDVDQHDGTTFCYVLPDAPDRALVEHTVFSLRPREHDFYDGQIRRYLDARGAGDVMIERTEYGSIPMEDRRRHQRWGRHIWNIGTVGGMTKPTTGYTFQRTHAQTQQLVATWARDGVPQVAPDPAWRYGFADRTLLNILHHRPELGRRIFERLFRRTPVGEVLDFLDENTDRTRDARMMSTLPWLPFVRAGLAELSAEAAGTAGWRHAA